LVLLPFVFAACQNPTAADYVPPPPPSYEPEPQPPQPPPPAYMVQDLEALHRNILGVKAAYGFIRAPHWFPGQGAQIYVYPITPDSYRAISAYLQSFRVNTSIVTFPMSTFIFAVVELSLTAQSLALVKYNPVGTPRRTQHIVPRYVRL
jgi:hypothetical protein